MHICGNYRKIYAFVSVGKGADSGNRHHRRLKSHSAGSTVFYYNTGNTFFYLSKKVFNGEHLQPKSFAAAFCSVTAASYICIVVNFKLTKSVIFKEFNNIFFKQFYRFGVSEIPKTFFSAFADLTYNDIAVML